MASKIKSPGEIDFNVQEEIVKRLPVKSLVRFRSVCKAWRCLIDSSYFIAAHTAQQNQPQHLFVKHLVEGQSEYLSIADYETFPQPRLLPTLPLAMKLLQSPHIVGSCNGVLCFDGYYYDLKNSHSPFGKPMVVLWNLSIRKTIAIAVPMPGMSHEMDLTAFGFGVCPVTNDPKILMFPQVAPLDEKSSLINDPREVMVYSLSSGKWKSPSTNVPSKSAQLQWNCQVIDRFMYWSGSHMMALEHSEGTQWSSSLIMSFDMTNDTFEEIELPKSLAHCPPRSMSISKQRESLLLLDSRKEHRAIWRMENGAQKSFTKLFTIIAPYGTMWVLGLRKSGTIIMEVEDDLYEREIVEYDPNSKQFNALEIGGKGGIFEVNSYMETLLLLGRSDCSSY